ncbi:MAG: exodeoxyribonuclease III [Chloroflexi bacterium HGW-Chloroflexi-9]|nr:MAG: exodeoxyribonuclease III [Chloroflexi bacterium HGW-Chloroflexi-9]
MLIATWNVNSVNARLPRLLEFLETHRPDVLCLQETKVTPDTFPRMDIQLAGYQTVDYSGGRWAGVALLVRDGLAVSDARQGLPGEPLPDEARWVEATVEGVRVASVYVINGRTLDDPMFAHKLVFLEAMQRRAASHRDATPEVPLVICGDFNIAPADIDVYDPRAFANATHVTPEERSLLAGILEAGDLVDAYREVWPDAVQYTWWDYRMGHFHKNLGLRIDLMLASRTLAARLTSCAIARDFRKGAKPSDHVPLLLEIADA